MRKTFALVGLASALIMGDVPQGRAADPVADFYTGKSITHIVGAGAGGAYDLVSGAVVAHMGKYIPGKPNFVVSNMAGASSLTMMNYLTNAAKKDGSVMGMIMPITEPSFLAALVR